VQCRRRRLSHRKHRGDEKEVRRRAPVTEEVKKKREKLMKPGHRLALTEILVNY
jgi:hypothetical protein